MKTALITGILGQDGSHLADLLLSKGYTVYGMMRRISVEHFDNVKHIMNHKNFRLVTGDLTDQNSITRLVKDTQPDEVYNLAAQSHVGISFDQPIFTGDVTGMGVTRVLEAIRLMKPDAKFYQASSSEMFGKVREVPQTEMTPFHSKSPYGAAKIYGYWMSVNYRESYNMFCSNGILFNHEGERRGKNFVTRKITNAAARIRLGLQDSLGLGNLDAKRDWGYAGDYVEAMWMMLQHDTPDDFIVATGETHTVEEFCEIAFDRVGLNYKDYVYVDPRFVRPGEVDLLLGNPEKIKNVLGWEPKVCFRELVDKMVEADMKICKREAEQDI